MKKITAILLAVCALGVVMAGCAKPADDAAGGTDSAATGTTTSGDAAATAGEGTTGG